MLHQECVCTVSGLSLPGATSGDSTPAIYTMMDVSRVYRLAWWGVTVVLGHAMPTGGTLGNGLYCMQGSLVWISLVYPG